ncbi:lipocalin-like domain-containing protein [Phenylobacterium sp.]|uniref:lipocalin-like domain-containing protein n=1 Tax=Phenylobacterium sp. TaxID=1871053 RepID=UPI0025CEE804|nr:lipocalin-like domain-containing protein [Phenylobacterium sp.]
MSSLVGSWRLVSAQYEFSDAAEPIPMYGAAPLGRLILTGDGRMSAMITCGDRSAAEDEAGLFRGMMAYSGAYRVEADHFVTEVDLAWSPAWIGTAQTRFFEIEGDLLSLVTANQDHPLFPGRAGRGRLVWRREPS